MTDKAKRLVRRRRVFYVPGYDPIPPRRYRELYRREARAQGEISDYDIDLKGRTARGGSFGWEVTADIDGATIYAEMDVLVWSDIVRASMSNSILATYLQMLGTVWIYVSTGALWRLMRLRKGPVIAALYPVGMLILQLLVSLGIGFGVAWIVGLVCDAAGWLGWGGTMLTFVAGGAGAVIALRWFRTRDGRFYAYYLMHDYAYSARLRGAYPPELETRLEEFASRIAQAFASDVDEVLVVGHSSGAHLAVSILADLFRAGQVPPAGPALGFLSLGQVMPMVSFLPAAHKLRADLRYLAACDGLTWVDVSAPGDGCAFALCDPVAVSGVAPPDKKWPLVISAAFTQTLSPVRWAALRWRFFRLHFQYLCAFDRPGDYDYFRITAGPLTLGERFDGRAPSASRIENPVSKFTQTARP